MILREYQDELVNNIKFKILHGYKSICAVSPTGSGKTIVIADIVKKAIEKSNRIYIGAHRKEIIEQISKALNSFNIPHGIISPDYPEDHSYLVYVFSVQTLIKRLDKYPAPSILLIDECHHLVGDNTWAKICKYYLQALILGFTATPIRTNGQGLGIEAGGFFDCLVLGKTTEWLTEQGYLSPARYFVPPQVVDLAGIRTTAGDYNSQDLEERLNKSLITGDAISHYLTICPNTPALAFCTTVKHAEAVAAEFEASGIPSGVLHGKTDKVTRKFLLDSLGNGTIKILAVVDIVSEGTDIPRVQTAIMLRPTLSLSMFLQMIGRILRPFEGKNFAFIIDHVGNVLRHGFADSPRNWTLKGTKKSKKNQETNIQIKQCANCFCWHKPSPACPNCGYKYKVISKNLKVEVGELTELTKDEQIKLRIKLNEEVKKAKTLDELKEIEKKRGYKKGWAEHKYEGKQIVKARYDKYKYR